MLMKNESLLETSEERIRLLRAGFTNKRIEELYIEQNNFKIVKVPILYEKIKLDMLHDKTADLSHEVTHSYKKSKKSILRFIFCFICLSIFVLLDTISISTIFLALILGLLFVPPLVVSASFVLEGVSVISKELRKLSVSKGIAPISVYMTFR